MKEKKIDTLPESELVVMQSVWELEEPVGTGRIVEQVEQKRDWSRSTIQVFLGRLEERGFLRCERKGRLKMYYSAIKQEEYRKRETKSFLENMYENSCKKLIASLVQTKMLSKEELEDIVKIMEESEDLDE
ncbi:MAG: BlaI/MecI/CopY family transcriptional regulator [Clostridium sp.]|nr:BlaI/MecI/CopY family transcriptional regulator [Clostridium sp.]